MNTTNTLLKLTLALSIVTTAAQSGLSEERSKQEPKLDRPTSPAVIDNRPLRPTFPKHWGHPPKIQTRDMIELPAQYGRGSSTLSHWIMDNLTKDAKDSDREEGKKKPIDPLKPKPPKPGTKPGEGPKPKPTKPTRPEPPEELKADMDEYKQTQQELQKSLHEKIGTLGKRPSKEAIRKVVEQFRGDNADAIDVQKELGKKINEWHKTTRPARPEKPEPTVEMKQAIEQLKSKQKVLAASRKKLLETLKGKSKGERDILLKEYKSSQQKHLDDLKTASKELREINRNIDQTEARRR